MLLDTGRHSTEPGDHLHFELYLYGSEDELIISDDETYSYGEGSVNPINYIQFDHLD